MILCSLLLQHFDWSWMIFAVGGKKFDDVGDGGGLSSCVGVALIVLDFEGFDEDA